MNDDTTERFFHSPPAAVVVEIDILVRPADPKLEGARKTNGWTIRIDARFLCGWDKPCCLKQGSRVTMHVVQPHG